MKPAVRRDSRPGRAATEFFHAVLVYLTLHAFASSIVAPCLRVMIAGLSRSSGVFSMIAISPAVAEEWSALEDDGKGGWPSWKVASAALATGNMMQLVLFYGIFEKLVFKCLSSLSVGRIFPSYI